MIPRQWLVSCHRKRASAEAHQSVSNPHAMPPHAAMAAATLGLAASALATDRQATIRQATDLCRRTLEGVPHTWRRALEACTKGCTTAGPAQLPTSARHLPQASAAKLSVAAGVRQPRRTYC